MGEGEGIDRSTVIWKWFQYQLTTILHTAPLKKKKHFKIKHLLALCWIHLNEWTNKGGIFSAFVHPKGFTIISGDMSLKKCFTHFKCVDGNYQSSFKSHHYCSRPIYSFPKNHTRSRSHSFQQKSRKSLIMHYLLDLRMMCYMMYKKEAYQHTIPTILQYPHLSIGPKAFPNENNGNWKETN